jgi:small GTP-binding protein
MLAQRYCLKVIIVGAAGVGKTNLIKYYHTGELDSNSIATVAPASSAAHISFPEMNVEMTIWDTAGEERFQAISKMFYRDSSVAIVCWDRDRTETVNDWVTRVREDCPKCFIFLATTKADLLSPAEMQKAADTGELKRTELGAQLHVMTSAITGLGIQELFGAVARAAPEIFKNDPKVAQIETLKKNSDKEGCC